MPELIYEKFIANVVPKSELDSFRENNLNISRERDNLTSVIGRLTTDAGFDPEKVDEFIDHFKELRDTKQQVDDGKLVKDSSLAQAVEAKTGEMKRTYEERIRGLENSNKQLTESNEGLKRDVNRGIIDREIMKVVTDPKFGARPEASTHILREAYDTFTIEDGKLVAKDKDGNVIYGADGATPLPPSEWLTKQQEVTPFFFKDAQGGGGGGGGGGPNLSPAALENMSPEEKMNYGREHGLDGRGR
jgi:hypothetical protein